MVEVGAVDDRSALCISSFQLTGKDEEGMDWNGNGVQEITTHPIVSA